MYTLPRFCEQKKEQFKLPFKLLSGYYNKFVKQQKQKLSYKKNWNREWKLIFFSWKFFFFYKFKWVQWTCELMISCKRHSTEKKKKYLILRASCENGLIDKASRKFVNFWICKFYFSNLKWELLLTKKKYFRPSRCTMKQTVD